MTPTITALLFFASHLTLTPCYRLLFEDITKMAYFVDKSNMLRIIFDENFTPSSGNPYYFISCPRYFGKTTNLRMIQSFASLQYDENDNLLKYNETEAYKIFKELKVADYPNLILQHMSRYPVIYLDLKTVGLMANNSNDVLTDLVELFKECLYDHPQLLRLFQLNSTLNSTPAALQVHGLNQSDFDCLRNVERVVPPDMGDLSIFFKFCQLLHNFYNRSQLVLLIDNYDETALNSLTCPGSSAKPMYQIFNRVLSRALRECKQYIKVAVIAGTSSLAYAESFNMPQLVTHYPFLNDHQFTEYFGVLHHELVDILDRANYDKSHQKAIIDYYKGYSTFPNQTSIYNPYSIGNYFFHSSCNQSEPYPLKNYWREFEALGRHEIFRKCPSINKLLTNGTGVIENPLMGKIHKWSAIKDLERLRDPHVRNLKSYEETMLTILFFEIGYLSHTSKEYQFVPPFNLKEESIDENKSTQKMTSTSPTTMKNLTINSTQQIEPKLPTTTANWTNNSTQQNMTTTLPTTMKNLTNISTQQNMTSTFPTTIENRTNINLTQQMTPTTMKT